MHTTIGLVDLGVAGGAGAGAAVRLGPGEHVIGRAELSILPERALVVQVDLSARVRVRVGSQDQKASLAGAGLTETFVAWPVDAPLVFADSVLEQRPVVDSRAVLEPAEDGESADFNRPPRTLLSRSESHFSIPAAPAAAQSGPLPWLAVFSPLAAAAVSALVFHSAGFLAIAVLTPAIAIANAMLARRRGATGQKAKLAAYETTVARIESDIAARTAAERLAIMTAAPSAVELARIARVPESRLWERRPSDEDHLVLRVGTADLASSVVVEDQREELEYRRRLPAILHDVPLTVPLAAAGVVGIAGVAEHARRLAAWFVAQLAVLQSPRDVQLVVLTTAENGAEWTWAAQLPHLAPALGQDARALVGNDAETVGRRIAELSSILSDRQAQAAQAMGKRIRFTPDVVIVWEGARRLRSYPGVSTILREGPSVGIYSLVTDESERALPEETAAVIAAGADGSADVRLSQDDIVTKARLDQIESGWYEPVAHALATIHDAGGDSEDALPGAARLTEVLQLEPLDDQHVVQRWAGGGRSTRAVIGVSLDGPFGIDLVADGPHGLIAGTTGAGKSELLQSLVASLAIANRPDAMNFVLVDYKGGAAFKDAVRLPHTVGMVTDLDAHLVERALVSLGAELTRRERLLARVGAKDIDDYLEIRERTGAEPMPRLVIIIDEFASMVRELPDFVTGLVNIAQRGRSLGIHLILATQRPSGVVSGDIRANTNLRIALRVTDPADSSDIIGTGDAAQIAAATPGRAYARLGHSSLVPFQAARVGGRRRATAEAAPRPAPSIPPLEWTTVGYPLPAPPRQKSEEGELTDLVVLVDAAVGAASQLTLPPNHSPWLPALPGLVTAAELPGASVVAAAHDEPTDALPAVAWALGDQPGEQAQRPVAFDLDRAGHLFISGSARTGRSQALRTLAGRLADGVSTADLHLFGIDMGNGALLPLTRLPHTGAVVQRSERERLIRLFERLQAELTRRQELMARLGVADIGEQRRQAEPADRLPHLVVMLDRWENFTSSFGDLDGGVLVEQVLTFLREGVGPGIHLVLTGDRSLLSGRISVLTEDKWVLRFADRGDYSMAGLAPRTVPEHMPDGRMLRAGTGEEAQIALLAGDPSATAQAAAITAIGERATERDRSVPLEQRPLRIDVLPAALTWDEAAQYPSVPSASKLDPLLGVGGDRLAAVRVDLAEGAPSFLIAGPPRSGRSNLLAVMTRSLLEAGTDVVLLTPRRSPVQALFAGARGVRARFESTDVSAEQLREALEPAEGRVVLVVDDGELARDIPGADYVREWFGGVAGHGGILLAGNAAEIGSGFSGWQTDIRLNQRGALLSPRNVFDGDLLGVRVPRSAVNGPVVPGRALVRPDGGELQTLQVPRLVE